MTASAPSGFLGWIALNGQYVAFFAQLLYWTVIAAVAVYAVIQLKRFVDNACGVVKKEAREAPKTVAVEEFTD